MFFMSFIKLSLCRCCTKRLKIYVAGADSAWKQEKKEKHTCVQEILDANVAGVVYQLTLTAAEVKYNQSVFIVQRPVIC
jgi:hypothetical protein